MKCKWDGPNKPRVLDGRHLDEFDQTEGHDDTCAGCLPCTLAHCGICNRNHADATCPECLAATRDDLLTIATLTDSLPAEAVHRGVNSEAAMLWGPTADPEAWRNRAMSAMFGRVPAGYLEDCRDEQHPVFVLAGWEQVYRDALDQPTDLTATLPRVVDYLDRQLHVMAEMPEPPFDEFAREVRACRAHMENVLTDGERDEQTRVPCLNCSTRLVKRYGRTVAFDAHVCPKRSCARTYDGAEFALAKADHLHSENADRFVLIADALSAIDRPEQTVRTWMRNGKVRSERDGAGRLTVWWPDVREMHLSLPRRRRNVA